MLKNKQGLFRSGWKIALVFTIIFGLMYLEGYLFDDLATNQLLAHQGTEAHIYRAYDALYTNWVWLPFIISAVIMIAVPIIAWKVISKRKLEDMGLGRLRTNKKPFGMGLIFGIVSITAAFVMILLTGNGYVASWTPQITNGHVLYLFVFIAVGFAEEILARGYIMSVLRQTKSTALVILISTVLFSLMHLINNVFSVVTLINIVLMGLLFAYMYMKSGSIWMPIGFHITWSYFQRCIYGFPVSGTNSQGVIHIQYTNDTILNGGALGPEGSLIVTAVIVLGFGFVKWYYRNSAFQFMDMDTPAALKALYFKVGFDSNEVSSIFKNG